MRVASAFVVVLMLGIGMTSGQDEKEPPAKTDTKIFTLRNRNVEEVAATLWELFKGKGGPEIRIAKDDRTNSLIIMASSSDLSLLEALISQLEKLPVKEQKGGL